jgi:hypothetical protein
MKKYELKSYPDPILRIICLSVNNGNIKLQDAYFTCKEL